MKPKASALHFVKELEDFSFELSVLDRVWNVLFPDQAKKWHHLHINKYRQTYYVTHVSGEAGTLEVEPGKGVRATDFLGTSPCPLENDVPSAALWERLITSARKWLAVARKDWIKAAKRVHGEYPLRYRYGVVPHALVRAALPGIYRLDEELGRDRTRRFVRLIEEGYFHKRERTEVPSMAASDYFRYCRIAYIAAKRKDEKLDRSLSGRGMYERYADGRHEGLLDIDPSSEQEFADWIDGKHPKRGAGGHPWEIKRGGNTTHIDLAVFRPSSLRKERFQVEVRGESIGRMAEAIRMFLAIREAGLPITIADPEGVRKRLLAQDRIGIVPSYDPLHGASQHFDREEDVFDVMHYDDFGRFKRRLAPFVTWEPQPILKPRDV